MGFNYNGGTVTNSFWDTQTSGQATSAGGTGLTTAQMMTQSTYTGAGWDFTNTWFMIDGNTRPFLQMEYSTTITNAHQLQLMAMNLGASYTLVSNIDMSELSQPSGMWNTTTGFVPIGNSTNNFTGTFDGLGQTIKGIYINSPTTNYIGLFGYNTGTIRNVGLTGENISVSGGSGHYIGGLVGYNQGAITNSYNTGTVGTNSSGNDYVGGLVGYNDSSGAVTNSYSASSVTISYGSGNDDDVYAGGLVGYNLGGIDASNSTGAVNTNNSYRLDADFVGGLVGYNDSSGVITNSYSTGPVSDINNFNWNNDRIGGLAGGNLGSIDTSHSTGSVTVTCTGASLEAAVFVGGLVGDNQKNGPTGTISNSYSLSSVTVTKDSGDDCIGGLAGNNDGAITNSYSAGPVSASGTRDNYDPWGDQVGGLVGLNGNGTISNSYSLSSVHTTGCVGSGEFELVGGLVGINYSSITNSYSTGAVSTSGSVGSEYLGGLVGANWGSITSSYWDTQTSGLGNAAGDGTSNPGGTGLTTAEMMGSANFSGWDFTSTWGIKDGVSYPYLSWQFTGSPQIISGMLNVTGGGKDIQIAVNGVDLAQSYTGANGFYYFAIPANSVQNGDALLTYINGNAIKTSAVYLSGGGDMTGFNLYSGDLLGVSLTGDSISNSTFATAEGSLSSSDILYTHAGNNLTVNNGVVFQIPGGTTFNLNGDISSSSFINNGTISGTGTIDVGSGNTITNNGTISPGGSSSTGTLSMIGNLVLGSGGSLNVRLGGTGAGQYDSISVNGNITMDGTLNASLYNGYVPSNNDYMPIITMTGTATGAFAIVSVPANFSAGYNLASGEAARLICAGGGDDVFTNAAGLLNWDNPANWSDSALPTSLDTALINSGYAVVHGTGNDTIGALVIANSNSLNVSGGSLTVLGATSLDGTLTVSSAGSAQLNGILSGAGAVNVQGGALSLNASGNSIGGMNISSGTLNVNQTTTTSSLTLSGGTLQGSGDVELTTGGTGTWSGGTLTGAGLTVDSGATLTMNGGTMYFGSSTLTNNGTVTWSAGEVTVVATGTVNNNGLMDIQGDLNWGMNDYTTNGYTTTFNNNASGTIQKSAGTGTLQLGYNNDNWIGYVNLNNAGLIDVQTGTVSVNFGSLVNTGIIQMESGATFQKTGGFTNAA